MKIVKLSFNMTITNLLSKSKNDFSLFLHALHAVQYVKAERFNLHFAAASIHRTSPIVIQLYESNSGVHLLYFAKHLNVLDVLMDRHWRGS